MPPLLRGQPPASRSPRSLHAPRFWGWATPLLLVGLAAGLYARTLHAGLTGEEHNFLAFARGLSLQALVQSDWFVPRPGGLFFRPFTLSYTLLDFALWRDRPLGYHLTNVLLHGLNASLVAWLVRALGAGGHVALLTGALFAAHPLHPEAVAWIPGRFDLFATSFYLLGLVAFLRAWEKDRGYWVPVGAFLLALLNKETALTLPLAIALAVCLGPRPAGRSELLVLGRRLLPLGLVAAGYVAFRVLTMGDIGGYRDASGTPIILRPSIPRLVGSLTVVPYLTFLLPWNRSLSYPGFTTGAFAILAGIPLLLAWRGRRSAAHPLVRVGALLLPVTVLPVALLLPVLGDLRNARFLYLPSVMFCVVLGGLLAIGDRDGSRRTRWLPTVLGVALLVGYGATTYWNLSPWLRAGALGEAIPARLKALQPTFPDGAVVYLADVPRHVQGAYVYHTGLDAALEPLYQGQRVQFVPLEPGLLPPRSRLTSDGPAFLFRWRPESMRWEEVAR